MARNTVLPNLFIGTKEGSRNISEFRQEKQASNCIGVQVLHLRCSMTESLEGDPYRFFTIRSELEVSQRGIQSEAKNLILFFLLRAIFIANRKMSKLFLSI